MNTPRHDDPERDAWLSEALRHAPDAQAAPPAALRDAILRQARAAAHAARVPAPASARGPWAVAWDWLARPRVAAGFASVMVATLVGVMWWGQPIDRTLAPPPAVDATPAPAATPPAAPAAPPEFAPDAPRQAATPAPRRQPARAAPPAAPSPAPAPTPTPAQVPALRERAPPPLTAAAPSPVEAARDEARAPNAAAVSRGIVAKAAAPAAERATDAVDARPATLRALLAAVAAQPERWGWERSGAVQALTPALQRWLAQLDAASAGVATRAAAETAPSGEASVLRLYRDGALAATLRLDDTSAGLVPGPRVALPPATLAALKQALDDATR
ncbi:MAG TPA: hypothetical protein VFA35_10390 [Burkholderiaceae bacterium]|nr:hypothetical protein [Burkholderiaceae bacterium]